MVAKAKVRIEGEDATAAAWNSALGRARGAASKFSGLWSAAVAGISIGAIVAIGRKSIELGDNLNKAAIKAGTSVKAISELGYAAQLADVPLDALSTALKKMQVSLSEAGTGSKQAKSAFDALGLSYEQLQKRKPEGQFTLIADRISKLVDPADRARAATELFGKAGADLLPMFEQGASGIAKAVAEARKLGVVIGDDQAQKLSAADDSIKRLTASWEAFGTKLTAHVAPAISNMLDALAGVETKTVNDRIARLSDMITNRSSFGMGGGVGGIDVEGARKELQELVGRRELLEVRGLQTGTSGGPTSRSNDGYAMGFAAADAAEQARKAKSGARAAAQKAFAEQMKYFEGLRRASLAQSDLMQLAFEDRSKNLDELAQAGKISAEEYQRAFSEALDELLPEIQLGEKFKKIGEAEIQPVFDEWGSYFQGAFTNAIDKFVETGKFSFRDMLAAWLKELQKAEIQKLLSSMFSGMGGGGSGGGGGGWGGFFTSIIGAFAGARADGGPVQAGQNYLVGERGMEIFKPRSSGTIVPNHAMGGGSRSVSVVYNIDARGATMDLAKALPDILRRHGDNVKSDIAEGLRSGRYVING